MQPEILNQLKSEIQTKCVAYDYVDATDNALSEFFINLIQVNKTVEEVNDELVQLVGSDYNPNLTTWVFERKAELENSAKAQQQQTANQQQEIHLQQQQIQQQQQQLQQQQQQVQEQEQQVQQQREDIKAEDENMDVASKTAKPDRQNRMFSKAIGSVIGSHEKPNRARSPPPRRSSRSRSRSPVRQSSRFNTDRHASRNEDRFSARRDDRNSRRHDDRHDSRQDGDRGRSNILSRLGNSTSQNNTSAGDKPSVFDRLGGARPIPKATPTTYQERCKYWPNCKNGDECIYVHPSTICPDFPNCPKSAMECLYIHPEVAKPVVMQPQVKKLPVPCKFFPYCTNPLCPFIHPVPAQQPFFMQAKPFAATGQRVQIPCRDGDNCTRPDCHFLHPKDPNPQAEIVCKFDGACTRPNCFYKHTKENKPNNGKPQNTNARQFSVAEDDVVERIEVGESADLIQNREQNNTDSQPSTMDMDSDVVMDVN